MSQNLEWCKAMEVILKWDCLAIVMQSDLEMYHQPLRLSVIQAISKSVRNTITQRELQDLLNNEWILL
jgi:hypothetical protein